MFITEAQRDQASEQLGPTSTIDQEMPGIKESLQHGRATNYELTAVSRDGRRTVVSYNATTFRDAEGKLQGFFAAARDITEQKKLEQQLRDSEAISPFSSRCALFRFGASVTRIFVIVNCDRLILSPE